MRWMMIQYNILKVKRRICFASWLHDKTNIVRNRQINVTIDDKYDWSKNKFGSRKRIIKLAFKIVEC